MTVPLVSEVSSIVAVYPEGSGRTRRKDWFGVQEVLGVTPDLTAGSRCIADGYAAIDVEGQAGVVRLWNAKAFLLAILPLRPVLLPLACCVDHFSHKNKG